MKNLENEKILIGPSTFAAQDDSPMKRLIASGAEVIDNPFKRRLAKGELLELLGQGVTGLIAGLEPLDREVLSQSQLKVVSRCGSGMTNVDQEAAAELGILVRYTPDGPVASVAELTLGAMLGLLRLIAMMDHELHQGRWTKKIGGLLEGRTVLIIGYGRIGRRVAELLVPFKVNIIAADPYIDDLGDGTRLMPLHEALPLSDIISLHLSGETQVLGQNEFDLIRPGAFLLNGARGELLDEAALVQALDDGRVAGAWIDAFHQEPYDGPLTEYDQVILTPHVGSYTRECRLQMETESVENLIDCLKRTRGKKT